MTDDLVKLLRKIGERVPVPCPDGIKGCLVFHFRVETDPTCAEAADRIEALTAEVERLRELLDAWLGLAREHLDTELAGRTFEALERTRK
jgi:hypothetical protein